MEWRRDFTSLLAIYPFWAQRDWGSRISRAEKRRVLSIAKVQPRMRDVVGSAYRATNHGLTGKVFAAGLRMCINRGTNRLFVVVNI